MSPYTTADESVRLTFVPETVTALTVRALEFTVTENEEAAGITFARFVLKVMSSNVGVEFSIPELR